MDVLSFTLIWLTLLLGPPVALLCAFLLKHNAPQVFRRALAIAAGFVGLVALGMGAGLSFAVTLLNVAAVCAAYVAYVLLVLAAFRIRPAPIGWLVGVAGTLPIAGGYVLGTVGLLALAFIIGDFVYDPVKVEIIGDLTCETTTWGAAMTDSGRTVSLYQPLGPLKLRLASATWSNDAEGRHVTCAELRAEAGR